MSRKPARLQVDPDSIPDDDKPPQSGHTFNIWYLKWAGGDSTSKNYVKLKFRVNIKLDSGYTKGVEPTSPICLFFARGCCYRGKKCPYLHRLPSDRDQRIPTQDCFGRDKTADYRDDMGGVGLLARANRTLYVSGIHMNDHIAETLSSNFLEFGSIDKIKVLHGKGCAFVSYRLEAEAQFAKEAMDSQSLGGNDVLSVRWANDDPNPNAQEDAKRVLEEAAMETVKKLLGNEKVKTEKGTKKRPFSALKSDGVGSNDVPNASSPESLTSPETDHGSLMFPSLLGATRVSALKKIKISTKLPDFLTNSKSVPILAEYASEDD